MSTSRRAWPPPRVADSLNGAFTNRGESFFSRLRCAEIGQHPHISRKYFPSHALGMAWHEDYRLQTNQAVPMAATGAVLTDPASRGKKLVLAALIVSSRVL